MTDQQLLRRQNDAIVTLTLNRPDSRNALSESLMSDVQEALDDVAEDPSVQVVVIAANGPVFCAGHDLRELRLNSGEEYLERLFAQCSRLMTTIVRHPKPVIAGVQGTATAAGCQLVASCDLAIASERALFATPGVRIGLFCSTPMVALSRNVGRKKSLEMLLTGRAVDARTACEIGLVNTVVPCDKLSDAVHDLATTIASRSHTAVTIGKEAFYNQLEMPLDEAYRYTSRIMVMNMQTRDAEEGIDAFLEKRQPVWSAT